MSDFPPIHADTPLDRLAASLPAWDKIPHLSGPPEDRRASNSGDQVTLERAKGAVMLRFGVNSHVAFAVLARWSRTADVSLATLATTLVDGTVCISEPPFDQATLDDWLGERLIDDD